MDEEERGLGTPYTPQTRLIEASPYLTVDQLETLKRLAERVQAAEAAPTHEAAQIRAAGSSPSILAQLGQFANDQPIMLIGAFAYGVIVGLAIAQHRGG